MKHEYIDNGMEDNRTRIWIMKQLCATLNALTVAGTKYYNSNYTISYLYLLQALDMNIRYVKIVQWQTV